MYLSNEIKALSEASQPLVKQFQDIGKLIKEINQRPDFQLLCLWYKAKEEVKAERKLNDPDPQSAAHTAPRR